MAKLMVMGTTSSAGKSLLVTGLVRYFKKCGYKSYPFKSQNMSSKAHTLEDGRLISTAQALQAFSAGLKPDVRMNPVLLMPQSNTGSMVVIDGEKYKAMQAREYFDFKVKLRDHIMEVFEQIEGENDIIVIEGAGSPAEINLRDNDIVNMGLAEMVDAPVILVADIDRGGVFASLYGTVMLLEESERARIKGLVINKFRGDPTLLESGIEKIEDLTGIPVIGLIPYEHFELVDEDSLIDYDKHANHEDQSEDELNLELDKLEKLLADNMDMEFIKRISGLK
ncbi:cobyric acid synthase [uncultured Ezakiella sp.]|uniref:cobyric acid synthase n=1 Tax=uncultured Ezakiella sp. TaxID=1637529 RepID=UPI0025DF806E|nr:cobyric acid synthase [uncultured Ezakiella sp.]